MQSEAFTNQGTPASGAERDLVLLLMAAGAEQPLLQDELGPNEVFRRVDALHFILIVEAITIHPQSRADEFVNAVGKAERAIGRGGSEPAENREDVSRTHRVSANVVFANLP